MKLHWSFYRFDYARYVELRPALRTAETHDDFHALPVSKETDYLLDQLQSQEISAEEARAGFVLSLCCTGEPLSVDRSFVRCVAALAAYEDSEEGRELLSALLSGGKNMEPWMLPSGTFSGFLTPQETVILYTACVPPAKRRKRAGTRPKRRRRPVGGAIGACLRFFRLLLDRGPLIEEMQELLAQIISPDHRRLFTFYGLLPNFDPEVVRAILRRCLRPGDQLLLSANLAPI